MMEHQGKLALLSLSTVLVQELPDMVKRLGPAQRLFIWRFHPEGGREMKARQSSAPPALAATMAAAEEARGTDRTGFSLIATSSLACLPFASGPPGSAALHRHSSRPVPTNNLFSLNPVQFPHLVHLHHTTKASLSRQRCI
jgi:hypothetical protein